MFLTTEFQDRHTAEQQTWEGKGRDARLGIGPRVTCIHAECKELPQLVMFTHSRCRLPEEAYLVSSCKEAPSHVSTLLQQCPSGHYLKVFTFSASVFLRDNAPSCLVLYPVTKAVPGRARVRRTFICSPDGWLYRLCLRSTDKDMDILRVSSVGTLKMAGGGVLKNRSG